MNDKNIPNHVAIIMDGNGRWAKKRLLPRSMGHKAGAKNLETLALHILDSGVKVLSVFAFSTENFKRSQDEVDYLMELFAKYFKELLPKYEKKGIKMVFSGRKEGLNDDVIEMMKVTEERTKDNTKGIFNICLNYGGQYEIVDAVKRICKDKIDIDTLTPELFSHYLYQDLPPIDLLIRTSGEYRLSNFMMYQASYSEIYFTDTYFPDFDAKEYDKALIEYQNRDRRFGGIKWKQEL